MVKRLAAIGCVATLSLVSVTWGQTAAAQATAPTSGVRPTRLIIRNATIVDGNGTPARGPFDITVVGNTITQLTPRDPVSTGGRAAAPCLQDERPQVDVGAHHVRAPGNDQFGVAELFGFGRIADAERLRHAYAACRRADGAIQA